MANIIINNYLCDVYDDHFSFNFFMNMCFLGVWTVVMKLTCVSLYIFPKQVSTVWWYMVLVRNSFEKNGGNIWLNRLQTGIYSNLEFTLNWKSCQKTVLELRLTTGPRSMVPPVYSFLSYFLCFLYEIYFLVALVLLFWYWLLHCWMELASLAFHCTCAVFEWTPCYCFGGCHLCNVIKLLLIPK